MPSLAAVLVPVLVLISGTGWGWLLVRGWVAGFDPAAKAGIMTLAGAGFLGFCSYFLGMISTAAPVLLAPVGIGLFIAVTHLGRLKALSTGPRKPRPLAGLGIAFMLLLGLAGALTPSTALDWDSLAYHLALPKMWLEAGQVTSVSFIHHSNFPQCVDGLFLLGELTGDQSASKLMIWGLTLASSLTLFGMIRSGHGAAIAGICALIFASIPMVVWESGTAYIDSVHGIYAGLATGFAARFAQTEDRNQFWLCAAFLGLAAGSKYTGLQTIVGCAVVVASVGKIRPGEGLKLAGIGFALAAPWYLKNWLVTGNPVYPFFFSVFGGKNWNAFASEIYTNEQKTFGIQGIANLGASLLGLVASPGRFTNPQPAIGGGLPFVTLGLALVPLGVSGMILRKRNAFTTGLTAAIGLQLLMWFALSQQSRYILALAAPMLFLIAPVLESVRWRQAAAILAGVQVAATAGVHWNSIVAERMPVLSGGLTRDEFISGFEADGRAQPGRVSVGALARTLARSEFSAKTKVALYDEVFGYYLPVRYWWANPGHTTELDYAQIDSTDKLIAAYRSLGITHVYLDQSGFYAGPNNRERWEAAAGLTGDPEPYAPSEGLMNDPQARWRGLIANAAGEKKLRLTLRLTKSKFLFEVPEP